MVDPIGLSQLIIAIPQIIDYSVKSIRLLREYRKVHDNVFFSLGRAEDLMYCLRQYVIIIQVTGLTDDIRVHLERALRRAHRYMNKLESSLKTWTIRLQLRPQDSKNHLHSEVNENEKTSSQCTSTLSSLIRNRVSCRLHVRDAFQSVTVALNKMRYLALGAISIQDALYKLETTNRVLGDFLPISQHLIHILSYDEAVIEFTRRAKSMKEEESCLISQSFRVAKLEETDDPIFYKVTENGEYKGCIVERRFVERLNQTGEKERALAETERLARMLREDKQAADGITTTEIGLLRCCGYMKPDKDMHELVFRKPTGCAARTLRNSLTTPGTEIHRIEDRIEFALKLATAVHVFHSIGFVHKSIRPETTLVMEPAGPASGYFHELGTPYLAGFYVARYDETNSGMYSLDKKLNDKLYHHPRQLGSNRPQKYQMSDDIYSLGVCLLEIGLWRSVFKWNRVKKSYVVDDWAVELFADLPRNEAGDFVYDGSDGEIECDEDEFVVDHLRKKKLVHIANTELNTKVNRAFCKAVVACLTFADGEKSLSRQRQNYSGSAIFYSDVICQLLQAKGDSNGKT